ncbi:two-component system histidine kinase [Amycolatopsis mediterranei S699]|uniref:histidine kinase n=2 Tax=Amycolatopsis mediterranei TaxID=33910 RepID=A0A0H3CWU6_AMYMU|nr:histidine kinase [Amycolatopsis mediterranei]ADJ42788.1 two-component system histidine kinase [Amycolatopsis mediterranei U32]AEK39480.1 two-component system histidine kinase [Amycolatopsis mediterranei S699]AFO74502.1 two-component system histidine kinase [Amycolatopsis mediterranei S699]AGT81631.1 two-component system histidine kinase [Amycolatopsis mediterranei RB]KDO09912.1 histidine kinase [Amycolatopsis mediterranei]
MSRAQIVDGVIAAGVAVALVVAGVSGTHRSPDLDVLGYAALAAGGLALAARRRAPIAVLAVTAVCALAYQVAGFEVPVVAYLFAVYAAVRAGHRIAAVVASVLMLAAIPLALLASGVAGTGAAFTQARDVLQLAWLIAAGAAGEALRQAERRADEAERTREETARRRADGERLHIARELHDSLTHQISVIKVQAEVAVHLAGKRGEDVPDALLAIRDAGREAARELRATLEALRDDDKDPPRGLDDVPDLVRRVRTTGLDAQLTVEGRCDAVPAAVGRTAYRIVQESLTNVARHAAAATASVRIDHRPGTLVIRVDDDGQATVDSAPGVGLTGMRERVTALGGRLQAGPRREGGFSVQAELPVDPA